jgi:ABC-2 type transport system ATP-binding protein
MTNGNHSKPASHPSEILLAEDLQKSYGPRVALRSLSFSLNAGRILGFLGPNGAGKTTAIRVLTTILEPDAGHFIVDGISSKYPEKIRRKIGVLPENLGFPRQITGIEYLTFFGQLYGRTAMDARTYGMELLNDVGLGQRARSLISSYSHGMRQRIGIARALINDPTVVFLDEPTLGLDPRGQQELLSLIQRIAAEWDVGVILCSHALSEIEAVCDDVIILMSGRVIASGSVLEVVQQSQRNTLRIQIPPMYASEAQRILQAMPDAFVVTPTNEMAGLLRVELVTSGDSASSEDIHVNNRILQALICAQIPVMGFGAEGGRLQDIFLQLTEETIK